MNRVAVVNAQIKMNPLIKSAQTRVHIICVDFCKTSQIEKKKEKENWEEKEMEEKKNCQRGRQTSGDKD